MPNQFCQAWPIFVHHIFLNESRLSSITNHVIYVSAEPWKSSMKDFIPLPKPQHDFLRGFQVVDNWFSQLKPIKAPQHQLQLRFLKRYIYITKLTNLCSIGKTLFQSKSSFASSNLHDIYQWGKDMCASNRWWWCEKPTPHSITQWCSVGCSTKTTVKYWTFKSGNLYVY